MILSEMVPNDILIQRNGIRDCQPDSTCSVQDGLYTRLVKPLFLLTRWMIIVDLDEFMYGRNESIAEYLKRVPEDVGRLEVRC